eukprot:2851731-Prymnesium_polylepis.1
MQQDQWHRIHCRAAAHATSLQSRGAQLACRSPKTSIASVTKAITSSRGMYFVTPFGARSNPS